MDGRQRAKYVGTDEVRARKVSDALEALQSGRRLNRTLRKLRRTGAQTMKRAKQRLEPLLTERGLYFHGRAIRQRRSAAVMNSIPNT